MCTLIRVHFVVGIDTIICFFFLDYPRFRGEATMSIPVMMGEETNSCQRAVELLTRINTNNEEYLKSYVLKKIFIFYIFFFCLVFIHQVLNLVSVLQITVCYFQIARIETVL